MKINQIYFELTNECNFSCRHCQNNSGVAGENILALDIVEKVVHKCMPYGLVRVSLSGGEPTLYSELDTLIDWLYREGLEINVLTNGYLINRHTNVIEKCRDRVFVQVSLDGYDRATFYNIRNNYKFDSIVQNIIELRHRGIGVHIKTTITRDYLATYKRFILLAEQLDCSISFNFLNPVGRAKEMHEKCLDLHEMQNFVNALPRDDQDLFPPVESFMPSDCSMLSEKDVFNTLKICANGDVYSCTGLRSKEFSLGNVYFSDIHEIVGRKRELKDYIERKLSAKNCENCHYDEVCNRCCVAFCEYNCYVG